MDRLVNEEIKESIERGETSINEYREKHGLPPVEGGDERGIMTPTGFIPLDRLIKYLESDGRSLGQYRSDE